jgi:O-antigen/teichoic acid export membrane protein
MNQPAQGMRASRSLKFDVILMLVNQGGILVLTAASSAITVRALGPSGRGVIAVALGLTVILIQIGTMGLTSSNPYFVAREPSRIPRIIVNTLWLSSVGGALLVGFGFLVRFADPALLRGVTTGELVIALAAVPGQLAMNFLQSILLGEGRTIAYNLVALAMSAAYLAALPIVLFVLHLGIPGVLVLSLTRSAGGALVFLAILVRHHPIAPSGPDLGLMREMVGYGGRVYISALLAFLVIRADLLLVNAYLGTTQAGFYSVTVTFADALYVVPTAFATNLFPRVARGSPTEMSASVFRIVAAVYGVLCLIATALAGTAITVLYGSRFLPAENLFFWLVPGTFCLGMLTVLSQHFAGRGFPLQAMLVWFIGLSVNLALNLTLLASHGTYIAALSSSIAYAILLVLHVRMFAAEAGSYRILWPRLGELAELARRMLGFGRTVLANH